MKNLSYLQKKIVSLMKENTGTHFLDSGFSNGRHWQRNQTKQFNFNESIKLDEYRCSIPIHVYMDTMFETNKETVILNRLLSKEYFWTSQAIEVIQNYCNERGIEIEIESEGNTYNFDNDLSQDFQFITFEIDRESYVIFQLHNGADARGGYTSSQVFKICDIDYFYIGMNCNFYDSENEQDFESFYTIDQSNEYTLNVERGCFIHKVNKNEVYPYSAAMGF